MAAAAAEPRGFRSLLRWPPSVEAVDRYGLAALACMAVPAVGVACYTARRREDMHGLIRGERMTRDRVEQADAEWRRRQLAKRRPKLAHLVSVARDNLECRGSIGVAYVELADAMAAVLSLEANNPELAEPFLLTASALRDELADATQKTREGKLSTHKTGEELTTLLNHAKTLRDLSSLLVLDREQQRKLWRKMRDLRLQCLGSQFMLWRLRRPDLLKAFTVICLARKHVPWLLLSSLLRAAGSCLGSLDVLFRAETLEVIRLPGWKIRDLVVTIRAAVFVQALRMALEVVASCAEMTGGRGLHHRLRTEVYSAMLRQDLEWYRLGQKDQRDVHQIFGEIFKLPERANSFIKCITVFLESLASAASTAVIIRQRSIGLFRNIIVIEWGFHVACHAFWVLREWAKQQLHQRTTKVDNTWLEPLITDNIPTLRLCSAEARVLENWNMYWRVDHDHGHRSDMVDVLAGKPVEFALREGTSSCEFYMLGQMTRTGQIRSVNDVLSLKELAQGLAMKMFSGTRAMVLGLGNLSWELARTYDIIAQEPSIGLEGGMVPPERRCRGRVEFRGVSFGYPKCAEVLHDISFEVQPGEVCGITGSSGSGKSTVLALLQRIYDTTQGGIFLDGRDIKTLNPVWLRRQISTVNQQPRIFTMSLLENLVFGCEQDPSMEEVEAACRAAHAYNFIMNNRTRFPLGFHSQVSSMMLSGGELQRVAIARALLMDSPILLLDEATSALDSEAQSLVKEGLRTLMHGRTVLVVAHRLETIKDASGILCLEGGRVCEQGTHETLVRAGGLYSRLYRQQIQATLAADGDAQLPADGAAEPEAGGPPGPPQAGGPRPPQPAGDDPAADGPSHSAIV